MISHLISKANPDTPFWYDCVRWKSNWRSIKQLKIYVFLCVKIVHPQKRRFARKALEACIGRILEVKGVKANVPSSLEKNSYYGISSPVEPSEMTSAVDSPQP
jgi:hypothetical protein